MTTTSDKSHYETFKDMPIEESLKMALPIPGLKSRISTAIIFSLCDLRKKGIMTLLTLSKSSNAYIKSQEGLPGFYSIKHDNSCSWFFEVKSQCSFLINEAILDQSELEERSWLELPVNKTPTQFGNYLRKNAYTWLQSLLKDDENCTEELKTLFTPDFKMTGWNENGPYHCDWTTNKVPKIKSDHLKGSKLSVYGTLDWKDQGWGNRKGTFRLRLRREGEEVEGSE